MSDTIRPALSAEEWKAKSAYVGEESIVESAQVIASPHGLQIVGDDFGYVTLTSYCDRRHAVAALALHGQTFGFTREMVKAMRAVWLHLDNTGWGWSLATTAPDSPHILMAEATDRIEALLPPEEK